MDNGFGQCFGEELRRILREDEHVGTEGAKRRGESALGVNFEIEESGSDGGACAKGEQHNEKAAGIGAEEASDDAPEHGSITCAMCGHHSPRKMGAGLYREARRSGIALPRSVTPVASAITTRKTMRDGSGAAPKIPSPRRRARIIPSAYPPPPPTNASKSCSAASRKPTVPDPAPSAFIKPISIRRSITEAAEEAPTANAAASSAAPVTSHNSMRTRVRIAPSPSATRRTTRTSAPGNTCLIE